MPAPSVPSASRKGAVLATSLFQWSPTPATSLSRSLTATSAYAPAPPCQCVGGALTSPPVSSSASPAPRGSRPGLASPGPGPCRGCPGHRLPHAHPRPHVPAAQGSLGLRPPSFDPLRATRALELSCLPGAPSGFSLCARASVGWLSCWAEHRGVQAPCPSCTPARVRTETCPWYCAAAQDLDGEQRADLRERARDASGRVRQVPHLLQPRPSFPTAPRLRATLAGAVAAQRPSVALPLSGEGRARSAQCHMLAGFRCSLITLDTAVRQAVLRAPCSRARRQEARPRGSAAPLGERSYTLQPTALLVTQSAEPRIV